MFILTGSAGFIGSAMLWRLNRDSVDDVIIVDEEKAEGREKNLKNLKFQDYIDKDKFIELVRNGKMPDKTEFVIHIGACSSTTVTDEDYVQQNNVDYTRDLAIWCLEKKKHFLYASSAATYGNGSFGYSDEDEETPKFQPLNLYGWSKQKFDLWALEKKVLDRIIGFKFFNVYGPNEYHKEDMKSVIAKTYDTVVQDKVFRLFKSYKAGYGDGEQKRDFVYIKDCVEAVYHFLDHPDRGGLYNIGTGEARSWNALARAVFDAVDVPENIEYIDMPENIREKYQYFTQAELGKLRNAGYTRPFTSLEEGIKDYCTYLKDKKCL